jgi:hypothetical protein
VQIITDNGSNYKKSCKLVSQKYRIVWQLCFAHTINLMLKSIREFLDHKAMIEAARRICRWFYNHNKLHAMMKQAIGGELVRWNAIRFGMNYMFLESMFCRKDKFMVWMGSPSFLESSFSFTHEGRYAHSFLSNMTWGDTMEYVLKGVEPLYAFLHFADQDKVSNMSEVLLLFNMCIGEYENLLHDYPNDLEQYIRVIKARMGDVANSTFVNAGTCIFHTCNTNVKHKNFSMCHVGFICC